MPRRTVTAARARLMTAIEAGNVHRIGAESYWMDETTTADVTDRVTDLQLLGWAGYRSHEHSTLKGARPVALTDLGREVLDQHTARADA
jgi:hypothetical protein